jgi:uncharacterized membrane protein YccF (DUF307 family)
MDGIRLVLNVLWLVLHGWALALAYLLAGVVACVLVVTIPFGIASFRLAGYAAWPFGRTTVRAPASGRHLLWGTCCGSCSSAGGSPCSTWRPASLTA